MKIGKMMTLKTMLCEELEKLTESGTINSTELEYAHKLTDTIKNIDKILKLEDEGEYSQRSYPGRYYYDDGRNSYARGDSYVRAHYRNSGTDYSRADGREMMVDRIQEMLDGNISSEDRKVLQSAYDQLRR